MNGLANDELAEIMPEMLAGEIEGYNETIRECKKHIEMHVAQQEEINNLKEEAKNDLHVSLDLKTMLFFINMGYNVSTPYLGGDKLGNFYYMTPINHYLRARQKGNGHLHLGGGGSKSLSCQHHLLPLLGVSLPRSDWQIRPLPKTPSFRRG